MATQNNEMKKPVKGTNPGDMVTGDRLIVSCRKPQKNWNKIQKSNQHNYFQTIVRKNAKAIVDKSFTNLQKG